MGNLRLGMMGNPGMGMMGKGYGLGYIPNMYGMGINMGMGGNMMCANMMGENTMGRNTMGFSMNMGGGGDSNAIDLN